MLRIPALQVKTIVWSIPGLTKPKDSSKSSSSIANAPIFFYRYRLSRSLNQVVIIIRQSHHECMTGKNKVNKRKK